MKTKKQLIDFEHKGNEKHSFKLRPTLLSLCMLTFIGGYSQTGQVNLNLKNATVKELFREIEKQTSYRFSYRDIEINNKGGITISGQGKELKEVLTNELAKQQLSYTVSGNKIIVSPTKKKAVSTKEKKITGKVLDAKGEPVIGATIMEKGTTNGTITDFDGNFTLNVSDNSTLEVSYVGYQTQFVKAIFGKNLAVTLREDTELLDEVVVVGYGTQRKGNLTGSVSAVKSEQITVAPISSVSNALGGVLPGLVVKQESGLPGSDGATLKIRGFDAPLVIVDGVESSFDNIDANQIESISILKDGAASIYGARAGNGVVLVTTKRGIVQKPTITVNSSYTLQGVTNFTRPANSYQRAVMERETHLQSGQPEASAPWTEEDIEHFRTGDDPLHYPNTDWYDVVFRNWAPQQNHNLSVRGGSEKIKYMGYFGYTNQETMVKKNGGDYKRYNLQSNMDASITENLKMTVDISCAFENRNFPVRGLGNGSHTWQDLYLSLPWYPSSLPDKNLIPWGGADVGSIAVTTNMDISGYQRSKYQDLKAAASLEYDFKKIVPGLKAKAFINFSNGNTYSKVFQKPVTFYTYDYDTQEYMIAGSYNTKATLSESYSRSTTLTQQYSLMYDNTFNEKHQVSALALFELIDYDSNGLGAGRIDFLTPLIEQMYAGSTEGMTTSGWASEMARASFVGRLNYNYKGKYLIETIIRADASAKFAKGHRWGYFPSVSLGWNLGEESWMKNLGFVDNMKLRASYGESGNDGVGNFQYLEGYAMQSYPYMLGGSSWMGLYSTGIANPFLSWENMKIYNAGLDFSFLSHRLYGTLEGFYRLRQGIPGTRATSLPSTFGATLPTENLNAIADRGFEILLGTSGKWGGLRYDISGNISYSRAKWHSYDEPMYEDPDQLRLNKLTGAWTDRSIGYVSDGLFTSQEEIDYLEYEYVDLGGNQNLKPGDVKYVDVNGDHKLDWRDQQEIGKGTLPHWMYGLNIGLQFKDFDLTGLFQGAFGYSTYVNGLADVTTLKYDLRWTEENNDPNAAIPRLGGSGSNSWGSDYWLKNTAYLRLKNMSIGYNIPKRLLNRIGVEKLRIYIAGTNLFTLSTISKYGVDPEVASGNITRYYPQQRTISFGVNLSL